MGNSRKLLGQVLKWKLGPEVISCRAQADSTHLDAERAPGGLIKSSVQLAKSCRHDDGQALLQMPAKTSNCMQMCHLCMYAKLDWQSPDMRYPSSWATGSMCQACSTAVVQVILRLAGLESGTRTFVHLQGRWQAGE